MLKLNTILNHKVVRAGGWYTITEFFLKGITFLTIPIFTRLLSPTDYGLVSLYMSWVGILTIVIGLNLNTSITKGKYDFKEDYDQFVSSVIFLSFLVFLGYLIIFLIIGDMIQSIIGFSGFIFYFMILQSYFSFIRTSLIAKLRVEYKYKRISLISIITSIFGVILSIILIMYVFKENPYLGKIIGSGILIIVSGIMFFLYMIKNGNLKIFNTKYWKYALFLSIPLIFHSLSNIVNAQFDRIIISKYIGDFETGLYSFAYNVGMIIAVLTYALDQAWSPWVYETMEARNFQEIRSKGKIYRNFYTIMYAMLLLLSPELIKIMASQTYWVSLDVIPYIFAGYYFSYMYTLEVKTEFFYGKTNLISLGTILSALINVLLNFIFVPRFGYIAAAVTTTVSYLFLFIFHFIITSKVIKKNIYGIKFHINSAVYMGIVTIYFMLFKEILLFRIIGFIISVLIFLYLLKNSFNLSKDTFKTK